MQLSWDLNAGTLLSRTRLRVSLLHSGKVFTRRPPQRTSLSTTSTILFVQTALSFLLGTECTLVLCSKDAFVRERLQSIGYILTSSAETPSSILVVPVRLTSRSFARRRHFLN